MGAFGNLLESYFGGTRHDVRTWYNKPKQKSYLNADRVNDCFCPKCNTRRMFKLHVYKNDKIRTKNEDWFCPSCNYRINQS